LRIKLTEHARERAKERGTTEEEIGLVLSSDREIRLKKRRKSKELVFEYNKDWLGKHYAQKKVEVVYTEENDETVVITVKVFYVGGGKS
jgi:hypothetical protein